MKFEEESDGYRMSTHVARLLEGENEKAAFEAFIADVFTQRIRSHHGGAMETARFVDALPLFIERAPRIIAVIVMQWDAADFSVGKIQEITDDIVRLEGDEFAERYEIQQLFEWLSAPRPRDPYGDLARHLDTDDPAAGAARIDREILAYERTRAFPENCSMAVQWAGRLATGAGAAGLGIHLMIWRLGEIREIGEPLTSYFANISGALPLPTAIALIIVGILCVFFDPFERLAAVPPPLPPEMNAWLEANGYHDGLVYWYDLYWSWEKIAAHRRYLLGFKLWSKSMRPPRDYPMIEIRPCSHWDYLRSAEGRAAQIAYQELFDERMDQWHSLWRRIMIGMGTALVALSCAALFITAPFEWLWRFLTVYGLMLCFIPFGIGWTPPLRAMPGALQRRWFRELPPEAGSYRDHMIALSA